MLSYFNPLLSATVVAFFDEDLIIERNNNQNAMSLNNKIQFSSKTLLGANHN